MRTRTLAIWTAAWLLIVSNAAAQKYTVTDIGVLPGHQSSFANWINSSGDVVGCSSPSSSGCDDTSPTQRAFLWTNTGGMQDLGTLPNGSASTPLSINDSGKIVGYALNGQGNPRAVSWNSNGEITDLGTLPGGSLSHANFVDSRGVVGGDSDLTGSGGNTHSVLWRPNGTMEDIGNLPGTENSSGCCIMNNANVVAGSSIDSEGNVHAFRWTISEGMRALPTRPGGTTSFAGDMNNEGYIVGCSNSLLMAGTGKPHMVLWDKARNIHDLGTLPGDKRSCSFCINDLGIAVGQSTDWEENHRAVLWTKDQGMQNLNDLIPSNSGWLLQYAVAINRAGQIVGSGIIDGQTHGFLLTPTGK